MALVDNFPFHFQLSYWPVQPSFSGFRCMRLTKRPTSNTGGATRFEQFLLLLLPASLHTFRTGLWLLLFNTYVRAVFYFSSHFPFYYFLSFMLAFYYRFALWPLHSTLLRCCCSDFETVAFLGLGFWTVHLQTGSSSDSEKWMSRSVHFTAVCWFKVTNAISDDGTV